MNPVVSCELNPLENPGFHFFIQISYTEEETFCNVKKKGNESAQMMRQTQDKSSELGVQ